MMLKISQISLVSLSTLSLLSSLSLVADDAKKASPAAPAQKSTLSGTNFEAAAQNLKFGFIDSFQAMQGSQEGKKVSKALEDQRSKMALEIQQEEQKMTKLVKEFQDKQTTLSEAARQNEQSKLVKMRHQYESLVKTAEDDLKLSYQQINETMSREITEAAYEFGKSKNLDVVIDVASGRVMWASEKADSTNDLIAIMDKNHQKKLGAEKSNKTAKA